MFHFQQSHRLDKVKTLLIQNIQNGWIEYIIHAFKCTAELTEMNKQYTQGKGQGPESQEVKTQSAKEKD